MDGMVAVYRSGSLAAVSTDPRLVEVVSQWIAERTALDRARGPRPNLKVRRYSPRYRLVRDRFADAPFWEE